MTINVSKIELSLSIHATEDYNKNIEALANIIGEELLDEVDVEEDEVQGGYENPIIFLTLTLKRKKIMEKALEILSVRLPPEEKTILNWEFEERFNEDKKSLHMRFDKQKAYKGNLKITSSSNCIRTSIKLQTYDKSVDFKQYLINRGILASD